MTTLRESPVAKIESPSQDSIILDSSTHISDKAEKSDSLLSLKIDNMVFDIDFCSKTPQSCRFTFSEKLFAYNILCKN